MLRLEGLRLLGMWSDGGWDFIGGPGCCTYLLHDDHQFGLALG